jgi:hypothetical protein
MQHLDRRSGPRRSGRPAVSVDGAVAPTANPTTNDDRRGGDRRKRKPGVAALFGAILGVKQRDHEE